MLVSKISKMKPFSEMTKLQGSLLSVWENKVVPHEYWMLDQMPVAGFGYKGVVQGAHRWPRQGQVKGGRAGRGEHGRQRAQLWRPLCEVVSFLSLKGSKHWWLLNWGFKKISLKIKNFRFICRKLCKENFKSLKLDTVIIRFSGYLRILI